MFSCSKKFAEQTFALWIQCIQNKRGSAMDLADEIYEMRDITYDEQITHLVGIVGQYSMQMTQNVKVDVVFS